MASRRQERREYNLTSAAEVAAKQATFSRTTFRIPEGKSLFNPKKGDAYEISIVPFKFGKAAKTFNKATCGEWCVPGKWHYEMTFFDHAKVGPNEQRAVCPAMTFNGKCIACEEARGMRNDPGSKDAFSEAKAKRRQLFLVYDHNDKKKGVQIWETAFFNFGMNLNVKVNTARPENKERWSKFHDPNGGYILRIVSQDKAMDSGRTNTIWMVDEFMERKGGLPDEVMDQSVSLDELIIRLSPEDFESMYRGADEEEESENGGTETSHRRGKKAQDEDDDEPKRGSRRGKDDDDSDDDDDEPKKGRRGKNDDDSDDDDDESDSDDDDDEPKRSRRSSKDEDSDDDDDEPKKRKKLRDPQKGDETSFTYRGKRLTGTITKLKDDVAYVDHGEERQAVVDLDDLEEPDKKAKSGGRKSSRDDDDSDDDDDGEPKRGKSRRRSDDDDDDDDDDDKPVKDEADDDDDEEPKRGSRGRR